MQSFEFPNAILGAATDQADTYETACGDVVGHVMHGINATIMCYGQTGSGKTYTMNGIAPRVVEDLFQALAVLPDAAAPLVTVSFLELYMERARDLVIKTSGFTKVYQDMDTGSFTTTATKVTCHSPRDVLRILELGMRRRATARTGMNEASSRSHAIFQISVERAALPEDEDAEPGSVLVSDLILADLAGSELARRTGATGARMDEARSINQSLSTLGRVIGGLTDPSKPHVPYRDSTLTKLLMTSLGGNARMVLICNVSLAASSVPETVSTLKFATRALNVVNTPVVNAQKTVAELQRSLDAVQQLLNDQAAATRQYDTVLHAMRHALSASVRASGMTEDDIRTLAYRFPGARCLLPRRDAFQLFPVSAMLRLYGFLPARDLLSFLCTTRRFREIERQTPELWGSVLDNEFGGGPGAEGDEAADGGSAGEGKHAEAKRDAGAPSHAGAGGTHRDLKEVVLQCIAERARREKQELKDQVEAARTTRQSLFGNGRTGIALL